jgi:predicted SAM-dependent methyltransferase
MYKGFDKINLGSGSMSLNGFFNVDYPVGHLDGIVPKAMSEDVTYRTPDAYMDITNLSDIPDNSFRYVRASHVFEHFCVSQSRKILKEWVRILQPGGTIDIVVPDFDDLIRRYQDPDMAGWWEETRNDRGLWWDTPERQPLISKEHALIQLLFLNGHHKAAFNFQFLSDLLVEQGISNIERYENNVADTALCCYSLCVKGKKPE